MSRVGQPPQRVLFSALTWVDGGMGGTETYARGVLPLLAQIPELVVTVHLPSNVDLEGGEVSVLREPWGTGDSTGRRLLTLLRVSHPMILRRHSPAPDLVHYPFSVAWPRSGDVPYVVTLHDVQHLAMPANFAAAERMYRRVAYDNAARNANAVITDSQFSKDEIVSRLGIPGERVHVIHLGMDHEFAPSFEHREPFVLYPARRWPHKNHARLVEAIGILRNRVPGLRLVLTGGGPPLPEVPDWVEQRGLVSAAELRELYRRAACMAYPSLYEGFGLPPLEAMASGCPVAVSRAGSLPEVCGDHGTTFDPADPASIADGIDRAMRTTPAELEAAVAWSRRFTWERAAAAHAEVYRSVARP